MLQNCSKLPLIAATMHSCNCANQPLLRRGMSTNTGDELSLKHLTVATQRRCRITRTSITMKEPQLRRLHGEKQSLDHARLSYNNGHGKRLA